MWVTIASIPLCLRLCTLESSQELCKDVNGFGGRAYPYSFPYLPIFKFFKGLEDISMLKYPHGYFHISKINHLGKQIKLFKFRQIKN